MNKLVFVAFVSFAFYYLSSNVGYQMAILYILAAAGVHNIFSTIKKAVFGDSTAIAARGQYAMPTHEEFRQNPEFNIVAASEKILGEHNGVQIPAFLIMENNSVYEYQYAHVGADAPKLARDEIMLDTGLVYKKSRMTLDEIQDDLLAELKEDLDIDEDFTKEDLEKLRESIKSLIDSVEEPVKPRKRASRKKVIPDTTE